MKSLSLLVERTVDIIKYNPFLVYCRELALGTVSLTGDRAQGDDSKHDSHYRVERLNNISMIIVVKGQHEVSLNESKTSVQQEKDTSYSLKYLLHVFICTI